MFPRSDVKVATADAGLAEKQYPSRSGDKYHLIIFLGLILVALLVTIRQYPSHSICLGSDQKNVACLAAGVANTDLFKQDSLLSDRSVYAGYHPWFLRLLVTLKNITGSYSNAYCVLVFPVLAFFMTGMYLLAFYCTNSKLFSGVVALMMGLVHIPFTIGGAWELAYVRGMSLKNVFAAFVPWLLYLGLRSRNNERFWPLVGVFAAALFHVHMASAPGWGVSILLALLISPGMTIPWKKRLLWSGITVVIALLVILAPALALLRGGGGPSSDVERELLYRICQYRYVKEYSNTVLALKSYFWHAIANCYWLPIPTMLIAGVILIWKRVTIPGRAQFLALVGGIFLSFAIGVHYLDLYVARQLIRPPLFVDWIRGVRYWPFFTVVALIGFSSSLRQVRLNHLPFRPFLLHIVCLSFCVAVVWMTVSGPDVRIRYLVKQDRDLRREKGITEVIEAIQRLTPPDALIYAPFWIRYATNRSIVHSTKEGSFFLRNFSKASEWWRRAEAKRTVADIKERVEYRRAFFELLRVWKAGYLIEFSRRPLVLQFEKENLELLYQNRYGRIIAIRSRGNPGANRSNAETRYLSLYRYISLDEHEIISTIRKGDMIGK